MGMSLSFYIIEKEKIKNSVFFTTRLSPSLLNCSQDVNLTILEKLAEISGGEIELINRMDSHRFDDEHEKLDLELHETDYEPFNKEWEDKKREIIQGYADNRKYEYPSIKEVKNLFGNIQTLLEEKLSNQEVSNLSEILKIDLNNLYPIELLIIDLKKLNEMIELEKKSTLKICWGLM